MKKTAVYIRVSTLDQNHESQRLVIEQWLANHGITDFVVFTDKATGDNLDREGFRALEAAIFKGEVSTVVIYKLDRLARSLRDGINTLTDWLDKGIRVVAVSQQFDFSGATGKLIAAVLLGVAEMEQETRRERQAAGIAVAKAKGAYKGRAKGSLKSDVAQAVELRAKGVSIAKIAACLGISSPTVYRYLKSA